MRCPGRLRPRGALAHCQRGAECRARLPGLWGDPESKGRLATVLREVLSCRGAPVSAPHASESCEDAATRNWHPVHLKSGREGSAGCQGGARLMGWIPRKGSF